MSKARDFLREAYYNYHPVPADKLYFKDGITVYKNKVHYPEQKHRVEGHPFEDITTRENFYSKCIDYVTSPSMKRKEPTEFLFYGMRSKQGMVMDFRVDELITNKTAWCFVIITILPYEQSKVSQQDAWKTKRRVIQEKSSHPSGALTYVLDLINRDKNICEGYNHVEEGEWDGSMVYALDDSLHIIIEDGTINSVGSKDSVGGLILVDLDA